MRSKEPSQLRYLLLSIRYQPKVLLNHLFLQKAMKARLFLRES